ncbi:MarR family winged helix-turn-helix transcriptional regulator [Kitasatospora sp. NBC_01266]|uniref:MarR family winged helix-turn-helix transcriptional regulator n=1 Tax=Kitasatospora sp. NBC_01266 TaxID=2903572 RepID=UPI002E33CC7C|nr:MarR family transcriptional regulator [Kitasatospora sp. NBC_01266]
MPSDELTAQVLGLFVAVNRRYAQESEAAATAHELTPLQAKALLSSEQPVAMRRVAECLHAEPSNVTAIVDRLEARGLVERRPSPGDRRVKLVAATESGLSVIADLRARTPFVSHPLEALSVEQRETLRELLALMLEG